MVRIEAQSEYIYTILYLVRESNVDDNNDGQTKRAKCMEFIDFAHLNGRMIPDIDSALLYMHSGVIKCIFS